MLRFTGSIYHDSKKLIRGLKDQKNVTKRPTIASIWNTLYNGDCLGGDIYLVVIPGRDWSDLIHPVNLDRWKVRELTLRRMVDKTWKKVVPWLFHLRESKPVSIVMLHTCKDDTHTHTYTHPVTFLLHTRPGKPMSLLLAKPGIEKAHYGSIASIFLEEITRNHERIMNNIVLYLQYLIE